MAGRSAHRPKIARSPKPSERVIRMWLSPSVSRTDARTIRARSPAGYSSNHRRRQDEMRDRAFKHRQVAGDQGIDRRHLDVAGEWAGVVEVRVVLTGCRQPAEPLGEHQLQDQSRPEDRHRDADHRHDPDQDVGQPPVEARRDQPERQPDDERQDQACGHQLDRGRKRRLEVGQHRPLRAVRGTPVAGRDPLQVVGELDDHRLVEPELPPRLFELCLGRPRTGVGHGRIARDDPGDQEREHHHADNDEHSKRKPLCGVSDH